MKPKLFRIAGREVAASIVLACFLGFTSASDCGAAEPELKSVSEHEFATEHVYADGTVKLFIKNRPDKHNPVVLLPSQQPANPEPTATAADRDRGYIVFAPNSGDGVLPAYRPSADEIRHEIAISATAGEFEHATFCIRPLKDLGRVTFEVGQLVDADDRALEAAQCDLYIVRPTIEQPHHNSKTCRWTTKWIELTNIAEAFAKQSLQVVVDIKVPADAAPGSYTLPIVIRPQQGKTRPVTINLEVLPIHLVASMPWGFYLYHQHWTDLDAAFFGQAKRADWEQGTLWKFKEIRRFGITGGVISHNSHPMPEVSVDGKVDLSAYDRSIELYRKAGFPDRPILGMEGTMWRICKAMGEAAKAVPFASRNNPGIEPEQVPQNVTAFARKVFGRIYDHSLKANWPPHYIYLTDKPFGPLPAHAGEMKLARISYPLARQGAPKMPLGCSVYSVDWWRDNLDGMLDFNIAPYRSVCSNQKENRRWRDYADSQNAVLRGIGWIGSIDTFWQGRHMTLIGEKGQLDGIMCWAQWVASQEPQGYTLNPYDRLRNEWKGGPFVLRRADGHIWRSLAWLGTREGIDDSRYLRTAKAWVSKATLADSARVRHQAALASRRIARIMEAVPWFDDIGKDGGRWTNANMDAVRRSLAEVAIDLKNALEQS